MLIEFMFMEKTLSNIGLALAALLLMCLLPMPYGFYLFVRFAAMIVFACFAYNFYNAKQIPLCVIFAALAILFQPFAKIALGRDLWQMVDVIAAIGLIYIWHKSRKADNKE